MRKRTDPADTTRLPRRLHVPAWYDRLARHPDARPVSWIITACCVLVSAVTLASFFLGRPPADASTDDQTSSPTPDAGYTTIHAAPPAPDLPEPDPTGDTSPTPQTDPTGARSAQPRQAPPPSTPAPAEPTTAPPPIPSAPATSPAPATEPEPTEESRAPVCSVGGVTYEPGDPGYDECREPRIGPGEPGYHD